VPQTDLTGVQQSYRMPTPMELLNRTRSSSRPASAASESSSLAAPSVAGSTSDVPRDIVTRMSTQGLLREFCTVHRWPQHEIDHSTTISDAVASEDKSNIDEANKHAWPSKDMKETMAKEALSQANAKARSRGKPVTDVTNVILKKVSLTWVALSCLHNMLTSLARSSTAAPSGVLNSSQ
jgi:hypothetical protein